MRVVQAAPAPPVEVDLEGDALVDWLRPRYARSGAGWLRVNLISAIGGRITGPSGTSADLSDGVDRPLMRLLRDTADVVLVGAASVRAAPYPLPRRAPLAIATSSGDLTADALPRGAAPDRVLVLCPADRVDGLRRELGERVTVVPVDGDPQGDPGLLVGALRARGLGRILCEGGGRLATTLLAAGLVDELCLASAPFIASDGPGLVAGDLPFTAARLDLLLLDATGRTYARWGFTDPAGPAA